MLPAYVCGGYKSPPVRAVAESTLQEACQGVVREAAENLIQLSCPVSSGISPRSGLDFEGMQGNGTWE